MQQYVITVLNEWCVSSCMSKREDEQPRRFYGRNGDLERLLEDLRWDEAIDEVLKKRKKGANYVAKEPSVPEVKESEIANPKKSYEKEDKKYKTG